MTSEIKKIAVDAATVAAKEGAPMTKQQAISLHLAKWLGLQNITCHAGTNFSVWFRTHRDGLFQSLEFNHFSDAIEGRAQFAECVIKVAQEGHTPLIGDSYAWVGIIANGMSNKVYHDGTLNGITAATLEAIYLATGGQPGKWEES